LVRRRMFRKPPIQVSSVVRLLISYGGIALFFGLMLLLFGSLVLAFLFTAFFAYWWLGVSTRLFTT